MKRIAAWGLFLSLLVCLAMGWCVDGLAQAERYAEVIPPTYEAVGNFSEDLAEFRVGSGETGKYGFIDKAGKVVLSPKFSFAGEFHEGLARVVPGGDKNGKVGYIDRTGKEIVPPKYDSAGDFCEGLAPVQLGEKWGFIDRTGKEVVPCKYYTVCEFIDGVARVGVGDDEEGLWGFVDTTGREVIPCQYSRIGDIGDWRWWTADQHPFFEGLAAAWLPGEEDGEGDESGEEDEDAEIKGKMGILDKAGKVVVPLELEYDEAGEFHEGLMAVMQIDRASYRKEVGDVNPADADEEEPDYTITRHAKVGFMDATGELVIPLAYTCPFYAGNGCGDPEYLMPKFSEGLAAVMNDDRQQSHAFLQNSGKFGYIDKAGKVVIPFLYDYAAPFSEGLAYVCQGDKFGYIDAAGNVVVPIVYDCDYYYGCDSEDGLIAEQFFFHGFAPVSKIAPEVALKRDLIDTVVRAAVPTPYALPGKGGNSYAPMQYGLIDKAGNAMVPMRYGWIDWGSGSPAATYSEAGIYGDQTGYIAVTDEGITPVDGYDDVWEFCEGFAAVARGEALNQKWGFIDETGREVVPCIYEKVDDVSEGLAAVRVDGRWGFIAIQ